MDKQKVLYGSGSVARVISAYAAIAGVVSDSGAERLGNFAVVPVRDMESVFPPSHYNILLGIGYQHGGMNARREQLALELEQLYGYVIAGFISARSMFEAADYISASAVVLPGTVLHAGSRIGHNVFIGSNCVIGHDVVIADNAWLNSGVTLDGSASVDRNCVIGANATVGAGVKLGASTLIGPGALVMADTAPGSVYLASPALAHRFTSAVFAGVTL